MSNLQFRMAGSGGILEPGSATRHFGTGAHLHTSDHIDSSITGPLCLDTPNSPSRVMYLPGKYALNALDSPFLLNVLCPFVAA